jgi:hypothetical protein
MERTVGIHQRMARDGGTVRAAWTWMRETAESELTIHVSGMPVRVTGGTTTGRVLSCLVVLTHSGGERSYTELKCLGDGSFGTVWLCDWHSGVLLSAMQCGAGARPEWAGKRLVALKRMKRVWEGGWSQAKSLGELVVSATRDYPPNLD